MSDQSSARSAPYLVPPMLPAQPAEADPVRAAAAELLESLRPLWDAGKLKGRTGQAVAALERALHA